MTLNNNNNHDYGSVVISEPRSPVEQPYHGSEDRPNQNQPTNCFSYYIPEEIGLLFYQQCYSNNTYLKSIPTYPPEERFKRHRDHRFRMLNNFRHWWKTSRLLVRLAGAYVWCRYIFKWKSVTTGKTNGKQKVFKTTLKAVKSIGRGGSSERFLNDVHPMTRSLRLVMAFGRAMEASVDNRFWEVLVAEAMAFMGNRSARWWARHITDTFCKYLLFPTYFKFFSKSIEFVHTLEVLIIFMGLVRAILPFASSFIGSRIGRQVTFKAVDRMLLRWRASQNIHDLVIDAGSYTPLNSDPELDDLAKIVSKAVGHGNNPCDVRNGLESIGFSVIGSGKGGYAVYRYLKKFGFEMPELIYLYLTPFGPSILDEMPRYFILEKMRKCSKHLAPLVDSSLNGFVYSGAHFSFQEWAALKQRYDKELLCYDQACKFMGRKLTASDGTHIYPPTDLLTLKSFVRSGRVLKKRRKDRRRYYELNHRVNRLAQKLESMIKMGKAPSSVIIYMEGLDCVGKSSTGGWISTALEKAGYHLEHAQYNKPPTDDEKSKPWMWRFSKPSSIAPSSIVWDRGPAGDFVYGKLSDLPGEEKQDYYNSFESFEKECISENILFLKILFIASRDSISKTLGKRLAHKKIVRDLHTWLDANSINHDRDGLNEIETHIDPTDFAALNKYNSNLRKFCDFALQTDTKSHDNHWMVISTSRRHQGRIEIMKQFEKRLLGFRINRNDEHYFDAFDALDINMGEGKPFLEKVYERKNDIIISRKPTRWIAMKESFPYVVLLLVISYSYTHQTWKVEYF